MHTLHIGFFVTGVLPLSPIVCRAGERFFLFPFPILSPTGAAPTQLQDEKFVFLCLYSHLSLSLNKIGVGSAESKLKTAFSFASTLTFHYLCNN